MSQAVSSSSHSTVKSSSYKLYPTSISSLLPAISNNTAATVLQYCKWMHFHIIHEIFTTLILSLIQIFPYTSISSLLPPNSNNTAATVLPYCKWTVTVIILRYLRLLFNTVIQIHIQSGDFHFRILKLLLSSHQISALYLYIQHYSLFLQVSIYYW